MTIVIIYAMYGIKKAAPLFFPPLFLFVLLLLADRVLGLAGYPAELPLPVAHAPHYAEFRQNVDFSHEIRTNSRGIRYRELPLEKSGNEFRVVVLGDSFTEGLGVEAEESFPSLLEMRFAQPGRQILFINCGLIGAGPAEYARILLKLGLAYQPDRVLLVIYPNDLADTKPLSAEALRSGEGWLVPAGTNAERTGVKKILHGMLPRIYTLVAMTQNKFRKKATKDLVGGVIAEAGRRGIPQDRIDSWVKSLRPHLVKAANEGRFNGYLYSDSLLLPDYWLQSLDIAGGEAEEKWRTVAGMLDKIAEICRERQIPLGIVYIPDPLQYDPTFVSPSVEAGMAFRKEWLSEESQLEKRLDDWAKRKGLPFLNTTPFFRERAGAHPAKLSFPNDPHLTREGNVVAAAVIGQWLAGSGFIPPVSSDKTL